MQQTNKTDNDRLIRKLVLIVIGMFGFGFAMVPIYDVLCEVTGLNGKTNTVGVSGENLRVDEQRTVTVEFIGITNKGMPWEFKAEKRRITVHPGEVKLANYYARNESINDLVGQAVPSVSPGQAATHFNKIECFCFNRQPLAAGSETLMPLTFYIDKDLPDDIDTVTLTYTMFDVTDATAVEASQSSQTGE